MADSWASRLSFQAKLIASVCTLVLITGLGVIWLAYGSARRTTEDLADSLFREVSGHAVTKTQDFVLRAAPLAESLGELADQGLALDDSDRLAGQLLAVLRANPGLSWVSYGDASGAFTGAYRTPEGVLRINQSRIADGRTRLVEHDVAVDGSRRVSRTEEDSGYDPRVRPFYQKAREAKRLVWLPPYIFYHQGVPGISCARPVYDEAGGLRGVLSIDFDLNALSEFVAQLSVSEHSRMFLFTADQVLLARASPQAETARQATDKLLTLADVGDELVSAFRAQLTGHHVRASDDPTFHLFGFRHAGADYYGSTTAFPVGDDQVWVVGALAPKDDFLGGVWRSQQLALALAILALLGAMALAALMARRVSGPVASLVGFMQRVGGGDLDVRADFGGSREFRQLSAALNQMIGDLRDRLRLRHSLQIAMEVQQRLLPLRAPVVDGLDVAGHSTYCDETGGDYYDFLIYDEAAPGRLLVALGDVMGHGVAAALVMAGARAVLRDRAATSGSLAELMDRLNRMLESDLGGERFMTMYLCVADAAEHELRWVSAGHDPAIVYDPATDGFEEVESGGLPLGLDGDSQYEECRGDLRPGQVITIGTDGVWESTDSAGDQFGKDRLRDAIRASASGTAQQIVQTILDRLNAFRGEVRATDDVTFVVVKVNGQP
jgi:sigma-B regulation protein RsbU (phosphoserine phosphatase)